MVVVVVVVIVIVVFSSLLLFLPRKKQGLRCSERKGARRICYVKEMLNDRTVWCCPFGMGQPPEPLRGTGGLLC